MSPDSTASGAPGRLTTWTWPVVWLAATAAITWSVVRFELLIVVVLTISAALLAVVASRGASLRLDGDWAVPLLLVGIAVVTELVPSFTYAARSAHEGILHLLAGTCVLAAVAWRTGGRARAFVPWIAAAGYFVAAVWVIRADPAPRIDVWVILQQASDGLAHRGNAYSAVWHGSPGERDAFTYLPWTLVLLAPGRWLFGDVRWALTAWTLAGAGLLLALGRWRRPAAWAAAATLLLVPGTTTQVEQSWTEPLLLALLAAWALLVSRDRAWWAVLPLALALASKQHIALLLPLLAVWPAFGWRRTAAAGGVAAALVAPLFIASPADIWHDTVTLLVGFHPILFANTLYVASIHELGSAPPFWLTGLVVLATLVLAVVAIQRRAPGLDQVIRWCALVLLVANLVNKQAFYNQYWLVAALVLLSVAAPRAGGSLSGERGEVAEPGLGEGGLRDAQHGAERSARGHVG
jgi:hypothetical protein